MRKLMKFNLFVFSVLLISSCEKEEDGNLITDQVFFSDENNVFSFSEQGDDIEFNLAVLSDTTDQTTGVWPDLDVYRIYADYNNNGELDRDVDLMFAAQVDGRVCVVQLLTQTSTSTCNYYEDTTNESLFSTTESTSTPHVSHIVSIPKSRLSNSSTANIIVHIHDADNRWSVYPDSDFFFEKTLEIAW